MVFTLEGDSIKRVGQKCSDSVLKTVKL